MNSPQRTNDPFHFRIKAEDRKYDCHRPNGCTTLVIEVDSWPGNEFGLWLPETIFVAEQAVWTNWLNDPHQDWQHDGDGTWSWTWKTEQLDFTATFSPDGANGALRYRFQFENN